MRCGSFLRFCLFFTVGLISLSCGATEDLKHPPTQPIQNCPRISELAPNTYALITQDRLPHLSALLGEDITDAQFAALLDAILTILGALERDELSALGNVIRNDGLQGLTQGAAGLLRVLSGDEDPEGLSGPMVRELHRLVTTCNGASLSAALGNTLNSPELPQVLSELDAVLKMGAVQDVLSAQDRFGRDGFTALMCNALGNLSQRDFSVANDVVQPIQSLDILPLDTPPLSTFFRSLDRLLSDEQPLKPALADLICCDLYGVPTCSAITATTEPLQRDPVFTWFLYSLFIGQDARFQGALTGGAEFIGDEQIRSAFAPLSSVLDGIAQNANVREATRSLLRSLLNPEKAQPILRDLALLIENGAVSEILNIVRVTSQGCDVRDMQQ